MPPLSSYVYNKLHKYYFTVDDNDYRPGPYNVTFATGQTTASFDVVVNDDNVLENNESFSLMFNVPSMFNVEVLGMDNQLTVSILNDDSKFCHLMS